MWLNYHKARETEYRLNHRKAPTKNTKELARFGFILHFLFSLINWVKSQARGVQLLGLSHLFFSFRTVH
jgi:hypothetical protein